VHLAPCSGLDGSADRTAALKRKGRSARGALFILGAIECLERKSAFRESEKGGFTILLAAMLGELHLAGVIQGLELAGVRKDRI
jgi:hypothetical protein